MSERRRYTSPLRHARRAGAEIEGDVDAEIEFHLEMREAALMGEGLTREEAQAQARREFGDVAGLRHSLRRHDRMLSRRRGAGVWLDELRQDVRFALRSFMRAPRFVLMALSTLVVGIGAAVAMFTVVNAVLLRPLPYPEAGRLVRLSPGQNFNITLAERLEQGVGSLEHATGIAVFAFTLTGAGDPVELIAQVVEPEFFELFAAPARGRGFSEEERGSAVVVISHDLWRSRFGSDPDVIGRRIPLDGYSGAVNRAGPQSREVIGVMPRGFEPPLADPGRSIDLWVPLQQSRPTVAADSSWYVNIVVARLREGATVAAAAAEVQGVMAAERSQSGGIIGEDAVATASAVGLLDSMVGGTRRVLWLLLAAVAVVLLLACTNLANLLLARGDRRRQELATRAALGATRGRVVRELLTESAVLAVAGAAGGILLARGLLAMLRVGEVSGLPRAGALAMDAPVVTFAFAVTALTLMAFALLPALRVTAGELRPDLGSSARTPGRTRAGRRFGFALMTAEVALAMVLVTGAALLLGTLRSLSAIDPGVSADDVLSVRIAAPPARYSGDAARAYYRDVEQALRALPGVRAAGAIHLLPMTVGNWNFPYLAEGHQPPVDAPLPSANFRVVTDGYFDGVDVPLTEGRAFDATDVGGAAVGIINNALAQQLWPGESAVGREILLFGNTPFRVVGVVADVRQHALDEVAAPEMYRPFHQFTLSTMTVVMEVDGDPAAHAEAARQAIWSIDADVPLEVRPLAEIIADSMARRRFFASVLTFFGVLALLLGGIGVYGVMSFMVTARMAEFSVRSALGASRRELVHAALAGPALALACGLVAGAAASVLASRLLSSLLFGVQPGDPRIVAAAAAVLTALGIVAGWVPALRAARAEPARLLRG